MYILLTLQVEHSHPKDKSLFSLRTLMVFGNSGGVHAAMVGSLHPTPVATLPFLSPHSAVVAFCEGILQHATAWEALREDLAAQKAAMTLEEVRERMRNVLSLTDVTRFPIPKNPDAVIFVAATVSTRSQYYLLNVSFKKIYEDSIVVFFILINCLIFIVLIGMFSKHG